jgi:hypothetical protein
MSIKLFVIWLLRQIRYELSHEAKTYVGTIILNALRGSSFIIHRLSLRLGKSNEEYFAGINK